MKTTVILLVLASLVVVLIGSTASAVHVSERSLQSRLQRSDLVVVGVVQEVRTVSGYGVTARLAFARPVAAVKGTAPKTVAFYISSDIAEDQIDCCIVGRRYLLFLEKAGAHYEVVNSRFGVYLLGKSL